MNPITHLLIGWTAAELASFELRRERAMVALAGVVPDVDGLGMVVELATRNSEHPLYWWSEYHHVVGHNLLFGLVVAAAAWTVARRRWTCALLGLLSFHLHLVGDLVGGRGPDRSQWPIHYLWPFSDSWQWVWSGQWQLNAWPNVVLTIVLLGVVFYLAWRRGYSPLEMISRRMDRTFVETLRRRFPRES